METPDIAPSADEHQARSGFDYTSFDGAGIIHALLAISGRLAVLNDTLAGIEGTLGNLSDNVEDIRRNGVMVETNR